MVDVGIHVADAAIGLRRASKIKEKWTKPLCFSVVGCRARKNRYIVRYFSKNTRQIAKLSFNHPSVVLTADVFNIFLYKIYSYVRVLLIDGGAVKKILDHSTRKNKSNHVKTHFQNQR